MGYAGTPGMVWGWLIAMFFIQCVAFSMAELCSSMPTSGGLYYASAVLAPPGYGPLAACTFLNDCSRVPTLITSDRVDRLVELAGTGDWHTIRRLRNGSYDPGGRLHHTPRLRSPELADLPADNPPHAHPRSD